MSIGSSAFSNVTQCWHPSGTLPATAAYWKLSGKCGLVKVEYKYDIWSMVYQEKKKKKSKMWLLEKLKETFYCSYYISDMKCSSIHAWWESWKSKKDCCHTNQLSEFWSQRISISLSNFLTDGHVACSKNL